MCRAGVSAGVCASVYVLCAGVWWWWWEWEVLAGVVEREGGPVCGGQGMLFAYCTWSTT